jgi:hypothetical protein
MTKPQIIPNHGISSMLDFSEALRSVRNNNECNHQKDVDSRLLSAAPYLLAACKEFVRKCECGEVRSVKSYNEMKKAIAIAEDIE